MRVELVDEAKQCILEGLPPGMRLEVHIMNGARGGLRAAALPPHA